ncbi:MAG: SRPBCC family protein [Flavobacteriales bacterium]|nr:SRPBCC family protein [Flavobacteriales bacterium]
MKLIKKISIAKPVEDVWEVLGNQFGEIDKWASLIKQSEVSDPKLSPGVVRSTETTGGPTKQELTAFSPEKHSIAYKAISGTPFFFKAVRAEWSLSKNQNITDLVLDFEVKFKGIGGILSPIVKKKLGKVGDELLEELKFYVENGKPHPRKVSS